MAVFFFLNVADFGLGSGLALITLHSTLNTFSASAKERIHGLDAVENAALRVVVGGTTTAVLEAIHWDAGGFIAMRRMMDPATLGQSSAGYLRRPIHVLMSGKLTLVTPIVTKRV